MKKPMTRSVGRLESIRVADQKLSVPILLSFMGHLIFCLLLITLPKFSIENRMHSSVINVELVSASASLPAAAPAPQQKAPEPEAAPVMTPEAPTPKAAVSTNQKPKEAVSLAPKEIETKQSMKKKTYHPQHLMENAIERVEKQVETSKVDPKQQALDRIREELKEKESQTSEGGSETAEGTSGLSRKGTPTSDLERIYMAEVAVRIQEHWAFSEQLAGGEKNLYSLVGFKIMRNGEIEDIWFDRRSGNKYFDDSTYKAIMKSSPLPPIPNDIKGAYYEMGVRFTPEGINR